jgi:hypothetical protein
MVDIRISGGIFKGTTYSVAFANQILGQMKRGIGFVIILLLVIAACSLLVEAGAIVLYGHVFPSPVQVGGD